MKRWGRSACSRDARVTLHRIPPGWMSPALCLNVGSYRLRCFSTNKIPKSTTDNTSRFQNNKHLQRARLKGELKPMLSLAIHSFLCKQENILMQEEPTRNNRDFAATVKMLARWNGFQPIEHSHLLVGNHLQNGRLLGQGLVAESSAFASENYVVLARKCNKTATNNESDKHPPFVEEDASWYRALEARVDDNLNRWEENARVRRQRRLNIAKLSIQSVIQRMLDAVQAPVARAFGAVTARLGPVMDQIRTTVRSNLKQIMTQKYKPATLNAFLPEEWRSSGREENALCDNQSQNTKCNETDPENLIILTKDGGSLMLLNDVHPRDRLLALPVVTTEGGKAQPPYRLRLARGGMVITVSIIALGAIPPTYRSLKFILEYPKTAEIVMITLVASVAYNMWSWANNARTRQRELIAAAIQSRLVARDEAATSHLTLGAVGPLTDVVMEAYVSRLLEEEDLDSMDPLVVEIGESFGLFQRPKRPPIQDDDSIPDESAFHREEIVAVEWEKARATLLHSMAVRM